MIDQWLEARRLGCEQGQAEIAGFVQGVVSGEITRPQAAAWLAFVACQGMTAAETVHLTRAMLDSGERLAWPGLEGPFIDKHSTGGVGDKVSLVLAPLWIRMGYKVPMISGRGLGITGGTLDKLEAIPGFRTDLNATELRPVLERAGGFITGQTAQLVPADRILYALRDETGTVPSIPLITASILSKKLAEGLDALTLDVKFGSGAFMSSRDEAEQLAESLVSVGEGAGLKTQAVLSAMSQPLGEAVGNALEVEESIATLKGAGPPDLVELVAKLSGEPDKARAILAAGEALPAFERLVAAQGGRLDQPLAGAGCQSEVFPASHDGEVRRCDARAIGLAAFRLGAGRLKAEDAVHPGVGVRVHAKVGMRVSAGDPLATLVHAERGLEAAREELRRGLQVA